MGNVPSLQTPLFLLSLIMTVIGHILIAVLVLSEQHLHTPTYFFWGNLSSLETCYSSTFLPRLLASLLNGDGTISAHSCMAQLYCSGCFATAECYLRAMMAYDWYLGTCQPLLYAGFMTWKLPLGLWTSGFLATIASTVLAARVPFCNASRVDHVFCDSVLLIKLSCAETLIVELITFMASSIMLLGSLGMTATSYLYTINTILTLPSGFSWL
ncbi:olfactory receptor 287-like [Tyto alba]|uniref:olfactory receptor 287-like n=1 Tax=Tyto alba TaxID=56313 RepID=UPI001C6671E3|nr:olfactory receptor 287-like [Tyto alba]